MNASTDRLWVRRTTWTVLADGALSARPRPRARVRCGRHHPLGTRCLAADLRAGQLPPLGTAHGGASLAADLQQRLIAFPGSPLAPDQAVLLAAHQTPEALRAWAARLPDDTRDRPQWRRFEPLLGVTAGLGQDELDRTAGTAAGAALLVLGGARPTGGSYAEAQMLAAVAEGRCEGPTLSAPTLPWALLATVHPTRMLERLPLPRGGSLTDHGLAPRGPTDAERQHAADRLRRSVPHARIAAVLRQGRGKKGTTSVWVNTAKAVLDAHGPVWLAREIAIIGAACPELVTGGDVVPGGQPAGPRWDPGTFVGQVRARRDDAAWWAELHGAGAGPDDHAAFALALLTLARLHTLARCLGEFADAVSRLPPDRRTSLLNASARLRLVGVARVAPGLTDLGDAYDPWTGLLLAHHAGDNGGQMLYDTLAVPALHAASAAGPAAAPLLAAAFARACNDDDPRAWDALAAAGPHARVPRGADTRMPPARARDVLAEPTRYPWRVIAAAEATL